jgi:hypothetical protein
MRYDREVPISEATFRTLSLKVERRRLDKVNKRHNKSVGIERKIPNNFLEVQPLRDMV